MRAPTNITGINWASPIASRLRFLVPLINDARELVMGKLPDVVRNGPLPFGINSPTTVEGELMPLRAFDGNLSASAQYLGYASLAAPAACSISSWWFEDNNYLLADGIDVLFTSRASSGGNTGWSFGHKSAAGGPPGNRTNRYFVLQGVAGYTSISDIPARGWHQVGATYDGSTARYYLDGKETDTDSAGTMKSPGGDRITIGATDSQAVPWGHRAHSVGVWDRVLSADEMYALWNPQTRWDIYQTGYRLITVGTAAASGGYTATMTAAMAALDASLAARVGRKAIIEGATAGVDVSGTLLADVHRTGVLVAGVDVSGTLLANVHRTGVLVAGAAASAVKFADLTRTGPLQASVTLSADLQAKAHRKATLTGATAETASLTGNIVMPSWTLNSIDSTHHVTDGPQINAAILDYGDAIDASDIAEAGRMGDAGASTYMNAFTTHGVMAADAKIYIEYKIINTSNIAQQACGVANSSYNHAWTNQMGDNAYMVACRATGHVRINSVTEQDHSGDVPYAVNDQWGMAFDANTGKIWFRYKGAWLNGGDPAAGTGEDYTLTGSDFEVGCTVNGNGEVRWNFGQRDWAHTPPSGFSGLGDF